MTSENQSNRPNQVKIQQKWAIIFLVLMGAGFIVVSLVRNFAFHTKEKIVYFADRLTPAHKNLIEKYNLLHKGKVRIVPVDFPNFDFSTNERKELLARSMRGREDHIDIFAVDLIWVQRFAKWSEPLGKYFSDSEQKRILDVALKSCYYEGELTAVPLDLVQGVMYYRSDMLEGIKNHDQIEEKLKQGITWEDFIKLKNKVNPKTPFYIFPAANYEGLICSFVEQLLCLKPNYFETDGFNFNTKEAEKSLRLLVDLVNKYQMTPEIVTEFSEIPSYEYFIKNDGYFIRGWPTYDKDFLQDPFDSSKESKMKKVPLPHFEGSLPTSVFGGWNLMISKFSENKTEAIEFVKFLISDESQEVFYREANYFPILKSCYDSPEFLKKYPELNEYKNLIRSGVHRPAHVEYTRYSEIMSYYFTEAIKNNITVKEALDRATNEINTSKSLK